jgi:hypothetical protein
MSAKRRFISFIRAAAGKKTASEIAGELNLLTLQVQELAKENNIDLSLQVTEKPKNKWLQPIYFNGERIHGKIGNKLEVIKEADGQKTPDELAEILGCHPQTIKELCHRHNLPYWSREDESAEPATWTPEQRKREFNLAIEPYLREGYSRMQAIEILASVADWLVNIRDPEEKIQRAPAVYDNPSREQLIDKILSE